MKNNLKKTLLILSVVLMLVALASCNTGMAWDIEVWGVWEGDNSAYGVEDTVVTIDNNSISVANPDSWAWDYEGEIVKWDNDTFNLSSENPDSGDYGYLIYKCTSHTGDDSYVGTYSLLRWKNLTDTTLLYSECAYKLATLEEAEAASDSAAYYSSLTKSE